MALPLSLLFPHCQVLVADLNEHSLQLLHTKAEACATDCENRDCHGESSLPTDSSDSNANANAPLQPPPPNNPLLLHQQYPGVVQSTALPNLFTLCGPIQRLANLRRTHQSVDNTNQTNENKTGTDTHPTPSLCPFHFDVGIALHLCGEATDAALRLCLMVGASLVAIPCCVGKLQSDKHDPYRYQSTGSNQLSISYPQSQLYRNLWENRQSTASRSNGRPGCSSADLWNALARAADCCGGGNGHGKGIGDDDGMGSVPHRPHHNHNNNAARRTAKALLEWDRCLFLREQPLGGVSKAEATTSSDTGTPNFRQYYSHVVLTKLEPLDASPKNDVIVAVAVAARHLPGELDAPTLQPLGAWPSLRTPAGKANANADDFARDLQSTLQHLNSVGLHVAVGASLDPALISSTPNIGPGGNDTDDDELLQLRVDWTREDEQEVERLLHDRFFVHPNPAADDTATDVYIFPPHLLGRHRRKLVHTVADKLGLEHWSYGRRQGGRTVAIALPGTRRKISVADR